jgi:hypothetical protein
MVVALVSRSYADENKSNNGLFGAPMELGAALGDRGWTALT